MDAEQLQQLGSLGNQIDATTPDYQKVSGLYAWCDDRSAYSFLSVMTITLHGLKFRHMVAV